MVSGPADKRVHLTLPTVPVAAPLTLLSLSAVQSAASWRIDYLYEEEGTLYGGVYRSPATSTGPTYFTVVTNDHGDVLELCDADGAAFAAYRYDAWGLPQGAGDLAIGVWRQATTLVSQALAGQIASRQILRYASYACDAESGLYYCSARYYDPATRQWTSGDPAKADGEESAYQYCGGLVTIACDPTGERIKLTLPDTKAGVLKARIRKYTRKRAKQQIPYWYGGKYYPKQGSGKCKSIDGVAYDGLGPLDCSGFVQGVLHEAGLKGMPPCKYGKEWGGDHIYGQSGWKGYPNQKYFRKNAKTKYQIGDILVRTTAVAGDAAHIVLVISNGVNPRIAESSSQRGKGVGTDGTRTTRLRNRSWWKAHKNDIRSGRFFTQYRHNIGK